MIFKMIFIIIIIIIILNYIYYYIQYYNSLKIMQKYNVIFVGTIRNVEKYILNTLNNIEKCGKKFKDYCIIIYENDSSDDTRNIIKQNKKFNYHYIFEDNVMEPRRTMRISNGRNKILEKINEININNYYTYMINMDMDDVNSSGVFVNKIETCFKYDVDTWDVLTGNQSKVYYDLWALRLKNILEVDIWADANFRFENPNISNLHFEQNKLIEVDSAFGGIAIYKLSSIPKECKYVGEYLENNIYNYLPHSQKCEHVEFNENIKKNGGKIFINTEFLTY